MIAKPAWNLLEEQRWIDRYEGLHLNSVRWLSDLPVARMDRSAGRFPSRLRWVAYLRDYVRQRQLVIRLDTRTGLGPSEPGRV